MSNVKGLVGPVCCEASKKQQAVYLKMPRSFYNGFSSVPTWRSKAWVSYNDISEIPKSSDYLREVTVEVFYCPFCGQKLPEIGPKKTGNKKIMKVTDGGDYCDTCGERLHTCECAPPEQAFKPI